MPEDWYAQEGDEAWTNERQGHKESHVCSDACPLNNVMIPHTMTSSVESYAFDNFSEGHPLVSKSDYLEALKPVREIANDLADSLQEACVFDVFTVALIGETHSPDKDNEEVLITLGFTGSRILDFIAELVGVVEQSRPGFIGELVNHNTAFMIQHTTEGADSYVSRIRSTLEGFVRDGIIPPMPDKTNS